MCKRLALVIMAAVGFSIFLFPISVHALPYTFEYSGHLTDRHTPGYDFGNVISGSLTFDLDVAADLYPQDPYYSESFILPGYSDFVTGYVTPNVGLNQDYVRFYNGFNEPDNPEPFDDAFNINDGSVVNGIFNSLFISVGPHSLDWLVNDHVTEFTFDADQLGDSSYAVFQTGTYYVDWSGPTLGNISEVYYQLDFAKLTAVNVPEPSALFLSFIGGIALFLSRRFNVR